MFFFGEVSHSHSEGTSQIGRKGNRGRSGRDVVIEVDQIIAFLNLDSASRGPLLVGAVTHEMPLPSAFKALSSCAVLLLFFVHSCFVDCGRGVHMVIIARGKAGSRWRRAGTISLGAPATSRVSLQSLAVTIPSPVGDPRSSWLVWHVLFMMEGLLPHPVLLLAQHGSLPFLKGFRRLQVNAGIGECCRDSLP